MSSFKVALIQLCPEPLEAELNFAAAEAQIRKAATQGARLAVLPEYHLSGWAPEDSKFLAIAQAGPQYVQRYCALAKELSIAIVPGTILVAQTSDGPSKPAILNIAYYIEHDGKILGEYTKTNLWHPERDHLTSGPAARGMSEPETCLSASHSVIDTSLGRIGLLVCYDLAFPEAFRALVKAGAEIIIIPTFTKADDMSAEARAYNANGEVLFMQSALISRAFENTCCIIFCNAGGPADEGYVGLSQVTLPIVGSVAGSFTDSETGVRIIPVDMKVVQLAEQNYKIRADLCRYDFHYP